MKAEVSVYEKIGIVFAIFIVCFFGTYKLSESPPTWIDEGMIIQTSKNLAERGVYAFQTEPQKYVSPSFISTSYPVTFPIALSFKIFDTGLLQARFVMVVYLFSLITLVCFISKKYFYSSLFWPLMMVGTFPPLYGNGKNVLGEIPGLFFLFLVLYFFYNLEKKDSKNFKYLAGLGLSAGLCVSTKPIFILILPAFVFSIGLLFYRNKILLKSYNFIVIFTSFIVPIIIWLNVQFYNESFLNIFNYYSNPHDVSIFETIKDRLVDFLTKPEPAYFLILFFVWISSIAHRLKRKKYIYVAEIFAAVLSFTVVLAYLRNPPYYRYFLVAEILTLFYLAESVFSVLPKRFYLKIVYPILILIFTFQFYQLIFDSWVSRFYGSVKTKEIIENISAITKDRSVFVYQAPEIVTFLKTDQYFQYLSATPSSEIGKMSLPVLAEGGTDFVVTKREFMNDSLFKKYDVVKEFNAYVLYKKK